MARYRLPIDKCDHVSIKSMIVKDLGYCCEGRFFDLYPQTTLIAARLGVSERAIRKHRAAAKHCASCPPGFKFSRLV